MVISSMPAKSVSNCGLERIGYIYGDTGIDQGGKALWSARLTYQLTEIYKQVFVLSSSTIFSSHR